MQEKSFSQACENNKAAILHELVQHFATVNKVLEIGSGTGQHAVYFAHHLPHVLWQCGDQAQYHGGINAWIDEFPSANLQRPISMLLPEDAWPDAAYDGIFSANTAHIMQKEQIRFMMQHINTTLPRHGVFCQYGPFIVDGKFTSQSNADFHDVLVSSGYGGYRSIDELRDWAPDLSLTHIQQMPANNLLLVWRK